MSDIAFRSKLGAVPLGDSWRRARGLPRAAYGGLLGHLGLGVMVIEITATSAWRTESLAIMKAGDEKTLGGYTLRFEGMKNRRGPNYAEDIGRFSVLSNGQPQAVLTPSKRLYDAPRQATTEAGIQASWRGDLYVVLGDVRPDGAVTVRVYFNPLVRFIWIGAVIMFIGGGISVSDRRLRIGMPARRRRKRISTTSGAT